MKTLKGLILMTIWGASVAEQSPHFAGLAAQEGSARVYLYREHRVMGMAAKPCLILLGLLYFQPFGGHVLC